MNIVRDRILRTLKKHPYMEFHEHKDLTVFTVGESYLCYDNNMDIELVADFSEVVVVVEKNWLFNLMEEDGIDNPLEYLKYEYTWDDSYFWFDKAIEENKVVMIDFN